MTAEIDAPRPGAVARQALRRLTESGLPPTPDHYAEHYYLIAGELTGRKPESFMCEAKPEAEVTTAVDSVLQILTDTTFSLAAELGTFDGQFQRFISEKSYGAQELSVEQAFSEIMKTLAQLRQRVADTQVELQEAQQLLQRMQDELKESRSLSRIDPLTGIPNRRGLDIVLTREFTPIASPFFAKPFGTSESPKGAKNWRRVIAFGAPAVPARLVRTQRGVRTPLADDSTPGRDALCKTYDRRYRVDLRSHTRRSGFRGLLDSLAHSLHVSQRKPTPERSDVHWSDRHRPT
ncbi:GGDEF domain-containing protein [Methylocaldum szegediense]|uniref:GGDEF domain-containing protein n=1 Tax=Methylocaldum szegediense TaxID=73780 RepID=UPI00041A1952|nr:GGDEF domain-containing protein [Methylocaldum szegediense]